MRQDNRVRRAVRLEPGLSIWLDAEAERLTNQLGGAVRRGGNGIVTINEIISNLIQDEMNRRDAKARKERAA